MNEERMERFKRVKKANDIAAVVGETVTLTATVQGPCPFGKCTGTIEVFLSSQRYYCRGCGKRGDVVSFVQERDGVEFSEAVDRLAKRAGLP